MRRLTPLILAVALAAASPALAQQAPRGPLPDGENGRFVFQPSPEGVVRLDTRTGAVSTCTSRSGGWACTAAADERDALEQEIERLRRENAQLKRDALAAGRGLPGATAPGATAPPPVAQAPTRPPAGDTPALRLPTEREVDEALGYVESLWGRVMRFLGDIGVVEPTPPPRPNRT